MALDVATRRAREHLSGRLLADSSNARPGNDVYRLDPLSHLDAGHVLIESKVGDVRQTVPFHPYDHECELVDAWVDVQHLQTTSELRWRNVHEEKTRQMGITWTCAWVLLWALMYHRVALLAQNVDLGRIDDGGNDSTTESLFGRIRFMARTSSWPEWLRPIDYLTFRQSPEHIITNRLTGGYLVGRGQEDDPARGGSYDAVLLDEAARLQHSESIQASVVSACPNGRLYNSTPRGTDNVYYKVREARSPDVIYLRHHWSVHPVYSQGKHVAAQDPGCGLCAQNRLGVEWTPQQPVAHRYPGRLTSPWYDQMVVRLLDEEQIAQELDISYERSVSARVYPEFSVEQHVLPTIPWDPAVPVELSFDYGWSPSTTSVGIWQDAIDSLRKIGEVEVQEQTPEQVAQAVRDTLLDLGMPPLDVEPRFTAGWLAVGDPAGNARDIATGETIVAMYRKQGFTIISPPAERVREGIIAVKRLLMGAPKPVRYSAAACPKTVEHMRQYHWPVDRYGRRKTGATRPDHDAHSHMCDADRYYVTFKFPAPQVWQQDDTPSGFVLDPELPYFRLSRREADQLRREGGDQGLGFDMRL